MIKFKEMSVGNTYQTNVLMTTVAEKLAKSGKPYCDVELMDGDETIVAKYFNMGKAELCDQFPEGSVIFATINVAEYNGSPNYKITNHMQADGNVDKKDFIVHAPLNENDMFDYIRGVLSTIKNPELQKLTTTIYDRCKKQLLYWSAAKAHHHNFYGGLLYHTYRMVINAEKLCNVYTSADKDMVVAACALHDIGKLKELDTDEYGSATYTVDGNLFGHLFIGAEIVREYGKSLNIDPEITRCLTHCIVSHHNNLEWGAITRPQTEEAFLVSQIDYIDSQYICYEEETDKLEAGTQSENNILGGLKVYRPAYKNN